MHAMLQHDGLSVRGHGHVIFGIVDHTIKEKYNVGDVRLALDVVRDEALLRGVDGVVHRRVGGGGRHRSDIITFRLLGGLFGAGGGLPHEPGRHGGVFGGSIFGGSVRGSTRKNVIFSNSLWTNSEYSNLLKNMFIWS